MKKLFSTKILIAMAVAIAVAAAAVVIAQEQPMPPPAASSLPPDIQPGTPLADVVKLLQADVDVTTIKNFIANCTSPFNLDANKIIYLKDEGLPSDVINAMMDHDKAIYASSQTAPPAPDTSATAVVATDTAPPAEPVTVNYFYNTLTPYGSWVDIEGYGRCWRPTAVIYDSGWRPYCDRGHWVYTDCGWYWDSDYSWGVTFHYGRWFRDGRFGWCWLPDTTWAPSWVAWRSCDDYCGWAPLPPFAVFTPGFGFFYRGVRCSADFDFGLDADFFVFISPEHFCDRRPRQFCEPPEHTRQIFHTTTIVNNYHDRDQDHGHTIVNEGISVTRFTAATHHTIEPVHVGSLPNAGRQGWRGEPPVNTRPAGAHTSSGNNNGPTHGSSSAVYDTRPAANQNPVHTGGQYSAPKNQGGNNQRDHSLINGSHTVDNSAPAYRNQTPGPTQPSQPAQNEQRWQQNEQRNITPAQPRQQPEQRQQQSEQRSYTPPPPQPEPRWQQPEQRQQQHEERSYTPPQPQPEQRSTPPPQTHQEPPAHSYSPPPQPEHQQPAASHEAEHSSSSDRNSDNGNNKQNH
jgi:hypothetical protein